MDSDFDLMDHISVTTLKYTLVVFDLQELLIYTC